MAGGEEELWSNGGVPGRRRDRHGRAGGEKEAPEQRPTKGGREPPRTEGDADRGARTAA